MIKEVEVKPVEEKARDYFIYGYHCSEALLKAFNEAYNLKLDPKALRMATGLGAGFGKAKCSCGSLTGGVLVLGTLYGRTDPKKDDGLVFDLSKELHDRFVENFRNTCCRVLTRKVKWGHPDHVAQCSEYVYTSAKILKEIIKETKKNFKK